jgi:hypothetical protein
MRMRKGPCGMASSSFHLKISSKRHLVITNSINLRHDFGKFDGIIFIPYFMNFRPAIASLLNAYGWIAQIWLGQVRDAHAQRMMRNGVTIIAPHDFKQPSG